MTRIVKFTFYIKQWLVDLTDILEDSEDPHRADAIQLLRLLDMESRTRSNKKLLPIREEIFQLLKSGGVLRIVVHDLETIARLYLNELEAAVSGDADAADRHGWMTLELIDQMTRSFSGGFMGRTMRSRPLPHRLFIESRIGWESKNWLNGMDHASNPQSGIIPRDKIYEIQNIGTEAESSFRQTGEVHRWMYDRVSLGCLLRASGFTDVRVCKADESQITDFPIYHLDTDESGVVRKPDSLFMEACKPN